MSNRFTPRPPFSHRRIVTRGFQISAWLLGVPSLLMALILGGSAFMIGSDHASRPPQYLDVPTYGLVGLLSNTVTGLGVAFSFMNGVVAGIFAMLAVLALTAALFAGVLGLVGRGLKVSAKWARPMAVVLLLVLALIGLLALTVLNSVAWFADGAVLAVLLYGLWVLVWRHEDHETA